MRGPSRINHGCPSHFTPRAILPELKPNLSRFLGLQGIELGRDLEDTMIMRVKSKPYDLVAGNTDKLLQKCRGFPRPNILTTGQVKSFATFSWKWRTLGP